MSEIMSAMDLSVWPKAALIIFIGVFGIMAWRAFREPRSEITRNAALPMDDGPRQA